MILPILLNKTRLLPIYVVGIGMKENQYEIVRKCGFPNYQILYCTEGSGIFRTGDRDYTINKGDAFFFRPDIPHEYRPTTEPWATKWIVFSGSAAGNISDYLGFGNTEVFSLRSLRDFDMQVDALYDMFWCDDPDKEIKSSCMMYRLIIKMGECIGNAPKAGGMTQNEKYEKISAVTELMKTRYKDDLSLDCMAATIGVTTNHLCRLFNQVYGTTPLKYLTQLRLNMAKYYLSSPKNLKVKDIAEAVGFHDASYFCAVFKKSEGMTPDDFRKIHAF